MNLYFKYGLSKLLYVKKPFWLNCLCDKISIWHNCAMWPLSNNLFTFRHYWERRLIFITTKNTRYKAQRARSCSVWWGSCVNFDNFSRLLPRGYVVFLCCCSKERLQQNGLKEARSVSQVGFVWRKPCFYSFSCRACVLFFPVHKSSWKFGLTRCS